MNSPENLYANRVRQMLEDIGRSMMALHGRDLYNAYALYGQELRRDIYDLVDRHYMTVDLQPWSSEGTVILPGFSVKSARRMRHMWDGFVFLYMSHKYQNIVRRGLSFGSLDLPNILYLRGSDYQLAITQQGAAVGHSTTEDAHFVMFVLTRLKDRNNIVKALSPSDLTVAMQVIGSFLAAQGNDLSSVAEFARAYDAGLFLSPRSWKARLFDLLPSSSLFLVYVSNQSNGLFYELECLAAHGFEANTILVLDERRFGARESFFAVQTRLKELGEDLYLSVDRDSCEVEDVESFEALVSRFPHTVALVDDSDAVLREIETLIPVVRRRNVAAPAEFPFEFEAPLDAGAEEEIAALRRSVGDFVECSLAGKTVANWPVLRLHVEMDIYLSLAFGDILQAAVSTARYAAMADFTRDQVRRKAPERVADLDIVERCVDIGTNIAHDALAMGEWNDYSDRRALARDRADAAGAQVTELMRRSVEGAGVVVVQEARPETPAPDPSDYSGLLERLVAAAAQKKS